jgi:hypothetical protein
MIWVEVFAVFAVSHLVGDFALQTEWQARNKRGGLGGDRTSRRALVAHVRNYTLAFVPAFVWLLDGSPLAVIAVAGLLVATHLVQDDGRLVDRYMRAVKGVDSQEHPVLTAAVDQTLHVVVLFGLAFVAVS